MRQPTAQPAPAGADERTVLSRTVLVAIATAFLLMGIVASAYGPLLEHLAHRFHVSLPVAGAVLSANFGGAFVGVVASMIAIERFPNRLLAALALACLGFGCAGAALAPTWPTFLAAVFILGIGFGGLDIGLNQMVAHSEGPRRSAVLNALNGSFGIGAVLGPVLVSRLAEHHFPLLYAGLAILAAALIPAALGITGRLPVPPKHAGPRPRALVGLFMLAFVLYVGTEAGVGGWVTSHLESVGVRSENAATLTSGFWLALGLGRMLVALLPARVPESAVVLSGAGLAAIALGAAAAGGAAPVAYIVTGFALAPIFPTGIVWLAKLLPGDARATSWLFPASMLGGALIPGGIGLVIAQSGVASAPIVLSVVAFGTFGAFALASRSKTV
jgi:FHS family glucose/mannose:H+ symporter-like MFS transporter